MRAFLCLAPMVLAACAASVAPLSAVPAPAPAAPVSAAPAPTIVLGADLVDADLRYRPPALDPARPWALPREEDLGLPGGPRARLFERHELPVVYGFVTVQRRERSPATDMWLCGALLDAAGKGRPLREELAALGATSWLSCNDDIFSVGLEVLASRIEPAVAAVAGALAGGVVSEERLAKVRERVASSFPGTPRSRVVRILHEQLFTGKHGYHVPLFGSRAEVEKVTPAEVDKARARLGPDAVTLLLAGDVTPLAARGMLERVAAAWPARARSASGPARPRDDSKPVHGVLLLDEPEAKEVEIAVSLPIPPSDSGETAAVIALANVIRRRVIRLEAADGTKQWADPAVDLDRLTHASVLKILGRVPRGGVSGAVGALLEVLEKIGAGEGPAADFAESYNIMEGWFAERFDGGSRLARRLDYRASLGLAADHDERLRAAIAALRPPRVVEAAKKHLRRDALTVVVLGPAAAETAALERLGLGKVIPIPPATPAKKESAK